MIIMSERQILDKLVEVVGILVDDKLKSQASHVDNLDKLKNFQYQLHEYRGEWPRPHRDDHDHDDPHHHQ